MTMKKGFVFTIVFSLFFLMLLYAAVEYLNILNSRQAALGNDGAAREAYVADDIGNDYLSLFGMKTGVSRGGAVVYWTIEDTPGAGNAGERILGYEGFVSSEYSKAGNLEAKAELDRSGKITLEPQGVAYRHTTESDVVVEGAVREYRVTARLSESCGACAGSGSWAWGEAGDGPFVSLDITDANGTRIEAFGRDSGYVMTNQTNTLDLVLSGGKVFELRLSQGYMRMDCGGRADTKVVLGADGSSEAKVYAPVKLTLGSRIFERIPLIEK